MQIIEVFKLNINQKNQLMDLWNSEYPYQLEYHNDLLFEIYLDNLDEIRHLLLTEGEVIYGWAYSFDRLSERNFAIILTSSIQSQGWGRKLIEKLKENEKELYGWVVDHNRYVKKNGKPYISPIDFYIKVGFRILKEERLETQDLSAVRIVWKI